MFKKMTVSVLASSIMLVMASTSAQASAPTSMAALQNQVNQLEQKVQTLKSTASSSAASISRSNGMFSYLSKKNYMPFDMYPSTQFNSTLFQNRDDFANHSLAIGGMLEFDAQAWGGDRFAASNISTGNALNYGQGAGFFLTTAEVNAMANLNKWTTAFIELKGLGMGTSVSSTELSKGFLLFGNPKISPLYFVLGKNYLPFGSYAAGGPWSSGLANMYFRPSETTQATLAFDQDGFNSNITLFNNAANNKLADFVYSFYYTHKLSPVLSYQLSAAYMRDIRNTSSWIGKAYTNGTQIRSSRNPAYDVYAALDVGPVDLETEYNQTLHTLSVSGKKGRAWYFASSYEPTILGKKTNFGVSYSRTTGLKDVPVPLSGFAGPGATVNSGLQNAWIGFVDSTIMKDVETGIEYMNGQTYNRQNTYALTWDTQVYF